MNYKFLLSVFASVIIFNSCTKDDSATSITDTEVRESYSTSNTILIDQVALYTKSGIETNPTVIQSFLDRHFPSETVQSRFALNTSSIANTDVSYTLEFLKGGRARFRNKLMDITQSDEHQIWLAETELTAMPPISTSPCGVLMDKVTAVTPRSSCLGGEECIKYKRSYPVQVQDGEYFIPVMNYVSSAWYPEIENGVEVYRNCSSVADEYPAINLLNGNLRTEMESKDTVLVQIGRLPMVKRP